MEVALHPQVWQHERVKVNFDPSMSEVDRVMLIIEKNRIEIDKDIEENWVKLKKLMAS